MTSGTHALQSAHLTHSHDPREDAASVAPGDIAVGVIIGRASEYFDFFVYGIASVLVFPSVFFPFVDKLHGIRWQEPLRRPGSDGPSSNRDPAMHHHHCPDTRARNPHRRRNHGNTVAGPSQCDQRLRHATFKQHGRPYMRNLAGSFEPGMRREA